MLGINVPVQYFELSKVWCCYGVFWQAVLSSEDCNGGVRVKYTGFGSECMLELRTSPGHDADSPHRGQEMCISASCGLHRAALEGAEVCKERCAGSADNQLFIECCAGFAENQYSSYEDALLDVKHGGEDVDIPWDAYDEEDKRAAAGCRSAMSNTYKRH